MTSFRRILTTFGAALLCGIVYTAATGHAFYNYKTSFTFIRGFELPGGIRLQPGKYTFRLADSSANRHIVEVFDEHETRKFATILAVDPTNEAVVMFGETPANVPQPIRFWYHSGRTVGPIGYEFVYPRNQAARIVTATNQHVLMTDAPLNDADAMKVAQVYILGPSGAAAEFQESIPMRASLPPSAASAGAALQQTRPVRQGFNLARSDLPEGTTFRLLIGLIGLLLLGATLVAVALSLFRPTSV
jgi:hypothetical protein